MQGPHQEVLANYTYVKDRPLLNTNNYTIWSGNQNETNIPVTIKLLKYPHIELPKYLKKLKEVKSEQVIKIFELSAEQSSLLLITEAVDYCTLKQGLATCHHLDEQDALFVARNLLNGHVECLRMDLHWFGTEDDIEFTDTGMKLSWNNSCPYNIANPFPNMLARLTARQEGKGSTLLPFPEVKGIKELIAVSKENAS